MRVVIYVCQYVQMVLLHLSNNVMMATPIVVMDAATFV
jgi:hypothetical protein